MFEKLNALKKRFEELTELIANPEIIAKQQEWKKLVKERAALEETVEKYEE